MFYFGILTAMIAALAVYIIMAYNGLVVSRQRVKEAWSTIDTQLKRRYDLIPNLIEVVKGYAKHETKTLTAVITARANAMKSPAPGEAKTKSENILSDTLKSIFALSEKYPDLKANENFLDFQQELADTESRIQATRQFYNTMVMSLNSKIEMFPTNIIAKQFHFKSEEYFQLDADERAAVSKAPSVKF